MDIVRKYENIQNIIINNGKIIGKSDSLIHVGHRGGIVIQLAGLDNVILFCRFYYITLNESIILI